MEVRSQIHVPAAYFTGKIFDTNLNHKERNNYEFINPK
jgi:hypothetical protein